MTTADAIRVERPATNSRLFAHTRWDVLPALAGLFHLFYFFALFYLYPRTSLWIMLPLGFLYSLMINANINRDIDRLVTEMLDQAFATRDYKVRADAAQLFCLAFRGDADNCSAAALGELHSPSESVRLSSLAPATT